MSVRAINWACDVIEASENMTAKAAQVLMQLAAFHNQETGRCNPSISRLVSRTKLSKDSVLRAIKELEKDRVISTEKCKLRTNNGVKNLSNKYRFNKSWGSSTQRLGVVAGCDSKGNKETLRGRCQNQPSAYDDLVSILDLEDSTDPISENSSSENLQ